MKHNGIINRHTAAIRNFLILLLLMCAAPGFSQPNIDSLQRLYKQLPGQVKQDAGDTAAPYLLFKMVVGYTDERYAGVFAAPLIELAQKRLAEIPPAHALVRSYKRYLAAALSDMGMLYRERGDALKALEFFDRSLDIYEHLRDRPQIGELYNNIATVYYDTGDNTKALEYFEKSYAIIRESPDLDLQMQSLANLAYISFQNNKFERSQMYYHLGLEMAEKHGKQQFMAEYYNGMGLLYDSKGRTKEALELFKKSLAMREALGDRKGIATTLNNIGNAYLDLGKYTEALHYSRRSFELSRELNSFERLRQSASALKAINEKLGNYKEALKMLELYFQLRDSTNNAVTRKAAVKMQLQYEYEKKEIILKEEQARLKKLYEQRQKFAIILSVILLALILIVFYSLYVRYKFKKEQESKNLHIELKERLKREIREKETIANSLINIQEHEREKLAADLHDGVNQLLFAAKMQLQAAKTVEEPMHREAVNLVDAAINEIKSIATNEGSFLLKNKLLKDALTDLIRRMNGNQKTNIVFRNHGFDEQQLSQEQKINILRIIQELLNNAIKHAAAKDCFISLKTTGNTVEFLVADNGRGMRPGGMGNGNGLKNISNKVTLMNGHRRTFSIPGKGTLVYISVPFHLNLNS